MSEGESRTVLVHVCVCVCVCVCENLRTKINHLQIKVFLERSKVCQ